MRVLFIDSNHPLLHETLQAKGVECDLWYHLSPEEIINCLPNYDGVVIRSKIKFTKAVIDAATRLKFIARVGAGMENIDVDYAKSKGIRCIHAPEGNMDAVGEHALAMLLALFNKLIKANQQVRQGLWLREENRGEELMGKTIGIIGYGNMGKAFAKRLQGFGVNVIAYDKYLKNFSNQFVKEVTLSEIFEKADVISLHTPLTDETRYLINDSFINSFKNNIYIINTARGKCLNTADLVTNLKSGKVNGACLDVLEYEAVSFENIDATKLPQPFAELIKMDNVILSPHIAGWSVQSHQKLAKVIAEKIINLFKL
ncbi:MAG: 2-hydroxyacid dehydrogenase [Bacteroidia bacterium]|nr:2-hydroxyacid dehydrogenase [Bacteroidia bacterium]